MPEYAYSGTELEIFRKAARWKRYFASHIAPFISGDVLEVGAGVGANLPFISHMAFRKWTCLEPDPALAARISPPPSDAERYETVVGTLHELFGRSFDTILYIDVLEHIQDDRAELLRAAAHLNPGGCVIVLAPAHPWLFSRFDVEIAHLRRYTRASLAAIMPPGGHLDKLIYLDCAGVAASAANRFLLESAIPSHGQVQFWDRFLVPISRVLDPIFGWRIGKSVLSVWRRTR